ncbi:MAG: hypothetical protein R3D25_00810 [Geminicoccaceae bacterium]
MALVETNGEGCTLRYLRDGAEFRSLNRGRAFAELASLGYAGYPAFSLKRLVHDEGVLRTFMRRLPPRSRRIFQEYEHQFRLSPGLVLSGFALLGQTGAMLPSDGFSLWTRWPRKPAIAMLLLEIAGYRYHALEDKAAIEIGMPVELQPEPENEHDPSAVRSSRVRGSSATSNACRRRPFAAGSEADG